MKERPELLFVSSYLGKDFFKVASDSHYQCIVNNLGTGFPPLSNWPWLANSQLKPKITQSRQPKSTFSINMPFTQINESDILYSKLVRHAPHISPLAATM